MKRTNYNTPHCAIKRPRFLVEHSSPFVKQKQEKVRYVTWLLAVVVPTRSDVNSFENTGHGIASVILKVGILFRTLFTTRYKYSSEIKKTLSHICLRQEL